VNACQSAQQSFVAYLDGELDARERRHIEDHVPTCSRCQRELEQLRRATLLVRQSLTARPREEEQVREALARAQRRIEALRRSRRTFLEVWPALLEDPMAALAAAVVAFLAVGDTLLFLELDEEALRVFTSYLLPLGLS